ncbi:potassium channel family protein [Acinetobacter ursingii]|uniref:TrkA family potassium uptake protein n=1 Tax=Acinetobacter ursingii TaxID=108980 RepID=A0A3D2SKH2_9GAMM|nr:TrkA family potassium uptake protein [Acinetobacter ursingii]MCH2003930.1 TrkA family potassium uptake protein [Acinetobacter ursingii]MCU4380658.1 TrkA family potassium uptake protein [Acinetobacter ursingii]MCU4608320.1 TrkA family potassium uptake protein [Acinetobacter ursingii]MDU4394210.1 TrkA family potassium uptake protein [Acinetobacter ursingii]HCK29523.1 TrkA family potassium uptake protein [Acinetobacter ursingii]
MAQFAVIGLGSFGATVALQLAQLNHDVIGIDTIKRNVEDIGDQLTHAVIADASDEHVLEELNIKNCAAVVVAIGEDIEASILCVLHLKNLGVPKIWVKAKTKAHHMILSHLHVEKIIHPEEDMGVRVAQALNYPMVSRYMALNDDHFIVKVEIPKHLNGVHLLGLIDATHHIKTILLQRGKDIIYDPEPSCAVQSKDILIIEGHLEPLKKLSKRFLGYDES